MNQFSCCHKNKLLIWWLYKLLTTISCYCTGAENYLVDYFALTSNMTFKPTFVALKSMPVLILLLSLLSLLSGTCLDTPAPHSNSAFMVYDSCMPWNFCYSKTNTYLTSVAHFTTLIAGDRGWRCIHNLHTRKMAWLFTDVAVHFL